MRITYLYDPLCGWCYGAAPAIARLSQIGDVLVQLAPTGIFAGSNARVMDASFATYAWRNDQRIAALTGQPFSEAYRRQVLGVDRAMFDSGAATLAMVAVAIADPVRELETLQALQRARYVDGRDTGDVRVVADVLAELGLPDVAGRVRDPDGDLIGIRERRIEDSRRTMTRLGIVGVPGLIHDHGEGGRVLDASSLFRGPDALLEAIGAAPRPDNQSS